MKNNKFVWGSKAAACFAISAFLAAAPLEIYAAEQQTYNITFSPGKVGEFTADFIAECEAAGGSVSDRTGSVKLKVPAGSSVQLPNPADVQIKEEYQGRYVVNTDDSFLTGGSITADQSESYVVDYAALVEGVTYRIEFIDAESGEEVAAPITAQGNVDQVVPYVAETIDGYTLSGDSSQTMTLTSGENTMTFTYTRNVEEVPPQTQIIETPGDTITRTETVPGDNVTITEYQGVGTATGGTGTGTAGTTTGTGTAGQTTAGTGTAAGAGDNTTGTGTAAQPGADQNGTAADDGTGTQTDEGTTVIGDEEVPLGQTDLDEQDENQDTEQGTTEIEDEDVPQGDINVDEGSQDKGMNPAPLVAAGVVVVVAAAGAIYYFIRRRK